MKRTAIILVLICVSAVTYSQSSINKDLLKTSEEIDKYLTSAVAAFKFNGVALVAKKGNILFHKAYGWKDIDSKTYNDTNTRFPILSITKSFTAILVLKLQEENKLSLKDKLAQYLPSVPNADKISIEQLLTHTSGLYNYTDDIGEEDSALVNHPIDKNLVLDLVSKKSPAQPPGNFSYNNSGYYLAGLVIEKVTGKSYEQNVKELIFEPLGMNSSGFDFNNLSKASKVTGYQFLNDKQQKTYRYVDSTVGFSAGSIYSTTSDMYKWASAIAEKKLLSRRSWDMAFKRKASDYGIGFRINNFFGNDYIKHSGGYPGFVSEFVYYTKHDITIILLKNSGNYGEDLWPVTMGISSVMLGLPYDMWKVRKLVTLPVDILKQLEGRYSSGKVNISFVVKDNRLYEVLSNGTELLLLAEDEENFYLENFNASVRFTTLNGTKMAIIHEHGKDYQLKKQ